MNATKSIETLQKITTGLTAGAFVHLVQGKHFESLGFSKLADKYLGHYEEEMGWVKQFMTRINDLGGTVQIEPQPAGALITDPIDYVQADLVRQEAGIQVLYALMAELKDDPTTYDILKNYLKDEEGDLYWSQENVAMVEMIGRQNWLVRQL